MKRIVYSLLILLSFLMLSACSNKSIIITFESNGGNYIKSITATPKIKVQLPIPEKEGYSFIGWFSSNDENAQLLDLKSEFNSDITLYAKYELSTLGLNFELINDEYSVTSYEGSSSEVIIPSRNKGLLVTTISKQAFIGNVDLVKVVLPTSIKIIHEEAFKDCHNLYTINLPARLILIGDYAFSNCEKLTFEELNAKQIGIGAFERCHELIDIKLSNSLEKIDNWAFYSCSNLNSVSLSSDIDYIGKGCFDWCRALKNIYVNAENFDKVSQLLLEANSIYTSYEVIIK